LWCVTAAGLLCLLLAGGAAGQTADEAKPGAAVPKSAAPTATPKAEAEPKIEGQFGPWALVCSEPKSKEEKQTCSLVQALVGRESNKLMFRINVTYGPTGNLLLRIDSPTGVALQKGIEFSPDTVKSYLLPFQTCLPRGCSALLVMQDDLKQELQKSDKGTITVYALSGQAVRALAELKGFAEGLAALDKRRLAKP
jgi:invasion protein IalB